MNQADAANNLHNHLKVEKELGLNSLFFDKVGLYLSLFAVVLIGFDTAANLLPGGADPTCFIPSNISATKEQSDFVNSYCDNQLPNTKFSGFTVFLQSFITTALYLLWDAYKNYYVHKYAENTQKNAAAVSQQAAAVSKKAAAVSKKAAPVSFQLAAPVSQQADDASQQVSPVSKLADAVSKLADALSNLAAPIAAPVFQLVAPVSKLADAVSQLAAVFQLDAPVLQLDAPVPQLDAPVPQLDALVPQLDAPVPQLDAPVPQLDAPVPQLDAPVSKLANALSQLAACISQQNDRSSQHNGNGCCTKYSLLCSYWIKHVSQLAVVATGVIVMFWELHWKPFIFDKTFLCYVNFDDTWSLSSVQCDYTSVALSPIFLATYFTISACILFAGIFALCSIHNRNMRCTRRIYNNDFMRLIAVGDTAERAYKKLQELKPLQ